MDAVETLLASRRLARWPQEWKELVSRLPEEEATVVRELLALLDASPADETGTKA